MSENMLLSEQLTLADLPVGYKEPFIVNPGKANRKVYASEVIGYSCRGDGLVTGIAYKGIPFNRLLKYEEVDDPRLLQKIILVSDVSTPIELVENPLFG